MERFDRHIKVPEIGAKGQEKLSGSSVLIVGAGGLGCPAALYLAAAGIGTIGIADSDIVSISNLQRQILYTEEDLDKKKVIVAQSRLNKTNSQCNINTYDFNIDEDNVENIIGLYDIIVAATDNFDSRFLLNKVCYKHKKPLITASVNNYDGQISVFKAFKGELYPCYECLNPNKLSNRKKIENGIVGPVAGTLGSLIAIATINEILEIGESLSGWTLILDMLNFEIQKISINKRKDCPICSKA